MWYLQCFNQSAGVIFIGLVLLLSVGLHAESSAVTFDCTLSAWSAWRAWWMILTWQPCSLSSFYGEMVPIKELCDRVAHYVHLCTLYWWLRFGHDSAGYILFEERGQPSHIYGGRMSSYLNISFCKIASLASNVPFGTLRCHEFSRSWMDADLLDHQQF